VNEGQPGEADLKLKKKERGKGDAWAVSQLAICARRRRGGEKRKGLSSARERKNFVRRPCRRVFVAMVEKGEGGEGKAWGKRWGGESGAGVFFPINACVTLLEIRREKKKEGVCPMMDNLKGGGGLTLFSTPVPGEEKRKQKIVPLEE